MPRRWLDPAFFTDEKLAKARLEERHLFAAMIANQDDDGRLLGHPGYLRSITFPYDDFTNEEVKRMRDHLSEVNPNVIIYNNGGNEYIQLKQHNRYQRPRYYHPSKFPAPPNWPFKDESKPSPSSPATDSNHEVTAQQPLKQPHRNHEETARYTEGRVRVGLGGVGSDLDLDLDKGKTKEIPTVSAAQSAAGKIVDSTEKLNETEKQQLLRATRLKPCQKETGVFLDMVEAHIGTKLVQRPRLQGAIRPLLVKLPEATPEKLFECFKWLKDNDPFYHARDGPAAVMALPSKYPEWAAGKLPTPGRKEERHGEHKQATGPHRKPHEWEEAPDESDNTG